MSERPGWRQLGFDRVRGDLFGDFDYLFSGLFIQCGDNLHSEGRKEGKKKITSTGDIGFTLPTGPSKQFYQYIYIYIR